MAELDVQPKKKSSILPWILLALGVIALIWFLTRDKDNNETAQNANETTTNTSTNSYAANDGWNDVDFNTPSIRYDEVTGDNINVRGNDNYTIYGLGENVLFDEGKSEIRKDAEANLKQIVASINKRYNGGDVRVYGFTDATGSTDNNKELAEKRAKAVQSWLEDNGIEDDHISVHPVGEAKPVASNSTDEGRQQNRRVEIVARGGSK